MPRKTSIVKVCAAAAYFMYVSRDIEQIAKQCKVSERTIRRWHSEEPAWQEFLDLHNYTGETSFLVQPTRYPRRDSALLFEQVRIAYIRNYRNGIPHHKLASVTAKQFDTTRRRVYEWAKRYGWLEYARKYLP